MELDIKSNIQRPFEYNEFTSEEMTELKKYFTCGYVFYDGFDKTTLGVYNMPLRPSDTFVLSFPRPDTFKKLIRLGSGGYVFYDGFDKTALGVYNMPLRPSDTFVLSFPRSGTTWTQELVWLLQNECDFEMAKHTPLSKRFPFIESGIFGKLNHSKEVLESINYNKFIEEMVLNDPELLSTLPSPRFIKSHIPISLMPPSLLDTVKVVYVARDPRDVVVSLFYHMQSWNHVPQEGEFKLFWNYFIQSMVLWCPYFEHVKEAWRQRKHPNMFFLFYEELSKDLPAVARRLAKFFGKEYSEKQYKALCDHLKFDNFTNNPAINREMWQKTGYFAGIFIRKGKAGGWREHFDAEMSAQAERWMADNLRDTDLRFPTV